MGLFTQCLYSFFIFEEWTKKMGKQLFDLTIAIASDNDRFLANQATSILHSPYSNIGNIIYEVYFFI